MHLTKINMGGFPEVTSRLKNKEKYLQNLPILDTSEPILETSEKVRTTTISVATKASLMKADLSSANLV
jgi:hypothetical protein